MEDNDQDPVLAASRLRHDADLLLQDTALLALLADYGVVHPTGSYAYDLMTWRDIDLCVATEDLETHTIFRLGAVLAALPHVGSMYYRNELVMRTPGNPTAVFWCVDFYLPDGAKWKVDILLATPEVVRQVLLPGQQLQGRLTQATRETILRIKGVVCQRPGYRQQFGSRAIYSAVTEDNVATVEEWDAWWAKRRA